MYGAIIGDIVGSKYEFSPIKSKDFPFVSKGCEFTDDTVMTVAVAKALMEAYDAAMENEPASFRKILVDEMRELGRAYPRAGYGGRFASWLRSADPKPYNSYGNGSAMRVSPCGLIALSLEEALDLARASAEVTHDHPEGIKGAQAVAACIFLAKTGRSKEEIRAYVEDNFYGTLPSVDQVRPGYAFDVTCQGSVPEAISCFLESCDYEDAVRNAVSLGGDADTQAAIAGSIAWTYYLARYGDLWPVDEKPAWNRLVIWSQPCEDLVAGNRIYDLLPEEFVDVVAAFAWKCRQRADKLERFECDMPIPL